MNKKEAWIYYKNWMKEKTISPALKSEIKITRLGWDHVVRGTHIKARSYKDRNTRIAQLKNIKYILTHQKNYSVVYRNNFKYYEIKSLKDKRSERIKVIIREDKQGNKVLYSWMKA